MISIAGNTYPVRDQLKKLGLRFNAEAKQWEAPTPDLAKRARALIGLKVEAAAPTKPKAPLSREETIRVLREIYATVATGTRRSALQRITTLGEALKA